MGVTVESGAAMLVLLLLLSVQSVPAAIVFGGKAGGKLSCGCQCSEIGFRATDGSLQGNCLSSDSGQGSWCYVDSACSGCGDLQPSTRFPDQSWSYRACRLQQGQDKT